jgi:hypothetical protein
MLFQEERRGEFVAKQLVGMFNIKLQPWIHVSCLKLIFKMIYEMIYLVLFE